MGNKNKTTTSSRLKELMAITGLRQIDILKKIQPYCEKWGIKIGSNGLSQYITGKVEPRQKVLSIFSEAFDINPVWLMGYDVPMNLSDAQKITPQEFRDEVLSRLDDVTNLTDKQKEMLKMNLDFICGDDNNE